MKRTLARTAFVAVITACVIATCIVVAQLWLPKYWGGGLGAAFGTLALNFGSTWFDRFWPQPKAGWSK